MEDITLLKAEIVALEKKIEDLTLEKQRVISIVSHDLRSPLNRLFALIQLLQLDNSNLTDQQKDFLEKMHLVIADGLAMMRNLADYRNLEYGTVDIKIESFNVSEFVKTTIKNFRPIAEKKGIQLLEECENDRIIRSDKQCVHRVLDNLISNALKFSSAGKIVWVRLRAISSAQIKIEIQDEARGFLPEDMARLFQKFQKITARPTAGESSTGLGLFVAKSMTEKIGGEISCKTTEGVGSVFSVMLRSIE